MIENFLNFKNKIQVKVLISFLLLIIHYSIICCLIITYLLFENSDQTQKVYNKIYIYLKLNK